MFLSIIIPTLNEEKNLKYLLKLIKKDDFNNYEIIVADAFSKDKTRDVAKEFGATVVDGGRPAVGRNNGVKIAKGDILLFLDADLDLSKNFINKAVTEFEKRNLDLASFSIYPRVNNIILNKFTLNVFYNYPALLLQGISPLGAMGIMVKKDIFDKVKGFDEDIKLAEDHYFMAQAAKVGNFGIIRSSKIYMPLRRFEQDGYIKTPLKYLQTAFYMNFFGPEKMKEIDYEFGHYDKDKK